MPGDERDAFAPARPDRITRGRSTWLLRKSLEMIHQPGAEDDRQEVLKLLGSVLPDVLETAGRWLDDHDADPMARWSVVYVLGQLGDERTLELLERQALRRLPDRRIEPNVCEHVGDAEELVSVMAIAAAGDLARAGVGSAVDLLVRVVAEQDRKSLRRPAVTELLSIDPDLRGRVAESLPDDERYLVELRTAAEDDVRLEVPERAEGKRPPRQQGPKPKVRRRTRSEPVHPPKERRR